MTSVKIFNFFVIFHVMIKKHVYWYDVFGRNVKQEATFKENNRNNRKLFVLVLPLFMFCQYSNNYDLTIYERGGFNLSSSYWFFETYVN